MLGLVSSSKFNYNIIITIHVKVDKRQIKVPYYHNVILITLYTVK